MYGYVLFAEYSADRTRKIAIVLTAWSFQKCENILTNLEKNLL